MTVHVKNYVWHRTFHQRILSDPAFQACRSDVVGVYFALRLLAATTNNNGSLKVGNNEQMQYDQVIAYVAKTYPDLGPKGSRKCVDELLVNNLICRRRSGTIYVTTWADEQRQAPTPEAERARNYRARHRDRGPLPPPPSAQGSDSESGSEGFSSERDASRTRSVTRHEETETEIEKRDSRLSDSERAATGAQGALGGGGREIDVWTLDPIDAALRVCDEAGAFYTNTWKKKFMALQSALGGDPDRAATAFREAIATLQGIIREKRLPRHVTRARYLHGILNKRIDGKSA